MKIRTGFVSNSSSSSFVIYGVGILEKDFINALKPLLDTKFENVNGKYFNNGVEVPNWRIDEFLKYDNPWINENSLSIERVDDIYYIGKLPPDFNDDKTMGESKKEIRESILSKFPGINIEKFGWIEETFYS